MPSSRRAARISLASGGAGFPRGGRVFWDPCEIVFCKDHGTRRRVPTQAKDPRGLQMAITPQTSFLATRRGKLHAHSVVRRRVLGLHRRVDRRFALPSIRRDLHFSGGEPVWSLAAVCSPTAGSCSSAARAADLLGRRRVLVAGTSFALSSLEVDSLSVSSSWSWRVWRRVRVPR